MLGCNPPLFECCVSTPLLSCLCLSGDKVLNRELVSEIVVSFRVSGTWDSRACSSVQFPNSGYSLPALIPDVRDLPGLRREGSVSRSPVVEVIAPSLVSTWWLLSLLSTFNPRSRLPNGAQVRCSRNGSRKPLLCMEDWLPPVPLLILLITIHHFSGSDWESRGLPVSRILLCCTCENKSGRDNY